MSTDLAIIANVPHELHIPALTTFDDWFEYRAVLEELKNKSDQVSLAVAFHTMDWLFWGEENQRFGEETSQGLAFVEDVMGWTPATYKEYKRVWQNFPAGMRIPGVGISFYQAVLPLPANTARELLEISSQEGWTREQLRRSVRAHKTEPLDPIATGEYKPATKKEIIEAARNLLNHLDNHEGGYRLTDPEHATNLADAIGGFLALPDIEGEAEELRTVQPEQTTFDDITDQGDPTLTHA